MIINLLTLIVFSIVSLIIGVVVTYFVLKSSTVKRNLYDTKRDELAQIKNELDTHLALEAELRKNSESLQETLSTEKEINQIQQREIVGLKVHIDNIEEKYREEKTLNIAQQKNIEKNNQDILDLKTSLGKVETLNASLQEKLDKQNEDFENLRKKSLTEFENIANKLFEDKQVKFSKQSKENLEQLLNPLKENLKDFKKKVEETYDKESKERFSLESKIKELVELNQQISQDANNLTNALKGKAKTQGNWGEMILENILEHSGLVKGREYFTQESYIDEKGKRKQPDVTIKYPNNRYIIIDSKVSLTAYERFANCEDPDEQKLHLTKHIESIKNHIIALSSKEYEKIDKALDFVMLFVPIEPAYMTAIHYDQDLWNFAYKKRILLISPTNLIAALKMVADIWKRERQNINADKIAKRGEMLYEKFVGFVNDMEGIEKHIERLNNSYTSAIGKLSKGRGNLIGQAENLKKLGINSQKEIPERFTEGNEEIMEE